MRVERDELRKERDKLIDKRFNRQMSRVHTSLSNVMLLRCVKLRLPVHAASVSITIFQFNLV